MSDKYPLKVEMSDKAQKHYERITALLNLENFCTAIDFSRELALKCAEQYIKGNTDVLCVTAEFKELYQRNREFFNALCEEGVVEWLTPLVLTESVNSRLKMEND